MPGVVALGGGGGGFVRREVVGIGRGHEPVGAARRQCGLSQTVELRLHTQEDPRPVIDGPARQTEAALTVLKRPLASCR